MKQPGKQEKLIFTLQVISLSLIWLFVSAITWWIFRLLTVSIKLHDSPDASVGISIVVIPIFIILASVLTYVFIGLHRHKRDPSINNRSGEPS